MRQRKMQERRLPEGEVMMNLIDVKGLCKNFKDFQLQNVDLTLEEGFIMGFIGRNGAGKTTTLKSMLNLMNTDGGTVSLCGLSMPKDEIAIKNKAYIKELYGIAEPCYEDVVCELKCLNNIFFFSYIQTFEDKTLFNLVLNELENIGILPILC